MGLKHLTDLARKLKFVLVICSLQGVYNQFLEATAALATCGIYYVDRMDYLQQLLCDDVLNDDES